MKVSISFIAHTIYSATKINLEHMCSLTSLLFSPLPDIPFYYTLNSYIIETDGAWRSIHLQFG